MSGPGPSEQSADRALRRSTALAESETLWATLALRLISGIVLAVTVMVLLSWLAGVDSVIRLMPGLPAMKFNTALGLALLALALMAQAGGLDRWGSARATRRLATWSACSALLLAALTILEMLAGVSLGIDELFVTDWIARASASATLPGRMASATATALLLLAIAMLARARAATRPRARWIMRACASCAAGMGLLAGSALLLSVGGLTQIPFFSTVALHTAWLITLLGGGVALAGPGVRRRLGRRAQDAARQRPEWRLAMAALAMLAVGLLFTLAIGHRLQTLDRRAAGTRFDRLADRVAQEARRRMELQADGLKGARGVYAASNAVERLEFRDYVDSRDLASEFPGMLGMGFIQRVARADLPAFLAAERADDAPGFDVRTGGNAPDLYVSKFIDPLAPNRAAWGFDMGSEPIRRDAIERAIRSGEPTLTPRITLVQDDLQRAGFLLLVPVYRNGTELGTDSEREAALLGVVYAAIVIDETFAGVAAVAEGSVDFELYEGDRMTRSSLLYDDDNHLAASSGEIESKHYATRMFGSSTPLRAGGRIWSIRTSSTPDFDASAVTTQPLIATAAGLLLSTLAAGLVWAMGRSRARAEELAVAMTADLRGATAQLEHVARTDKLTGLPNRALLLDRIGHAIKRAARNPARGYAVLFLDFDRFKLINDTLGHDAGDEILIQIARRLREELRTTDSIALGAGGHTAARMGGDEFVVLLEDLGAPGDAALVAARLLDTLAAPYQFAGQAVISTPSIGVVIGGPAYRNAADALRDADVAMYEAKAAGRARYAVFDAAMRERVVRRAELERDLMGAAERGEMTLHYQPIVRIETGRIEQVEALLRWRHPSLGSIGPAEFIPIAEESGQIVGLGEWVVREASAQARRWRASLGREHTPMVAVNISRRQLETPGLTERLVAISRRAGVEPEALCLEITETAVMRDPESAIDQLKRLRAAGFRLALDDFGAGQSSLASLHNLPLDVVKLDRAFVAQSGLGRAHAAMLHAVTSLAATLGLQVVAEGVETPEQLALLQRLNCQFAQGYLFGKAAPAAEIRLGAGALPAAA